MFVPGATTRSSNGTTRLVVALLLLALFLAQARFGLDLDLLRQSFQWISTPLRWPLFSAKSWLDRNRRKAKEREALEEKNEQLRRRVETLSLRLLTLEEQEAENSRLARLLAYRNRTEDLRLACAPVVGMVREGRFRRLTIGLGSEADLEAGCPVLLPEGVLGRLVRVSRGHGEVMLLQDPLSSIGVVLQEDRSKGDAQGQGTGLLVIRNVPAERKVEVGDRVFTSGLSTFYPKGLLVGTVVATRQIRESLYQQVFVRPAASPWACDEVLVVRRGRR